MRRLIMIIVFIAFFSISAAFAAFNMTEVSINFYFSEINLPLSIVIVIAVIIGALLGALALLLSTLKLRYENRRLQRKLSLSEQEINSLRILPIKDNH